MNPLIAPSMLSADFLRLGEEVDMINNSEADWFHLDIMDGVFVPNISFGIPVVKAISILAVKPLDVHLMIVQPEKYINAFSDAGADILTIHYEASTHLHRSLQAIRQAGMKAGIVLNPHTPVNVLESIVEFADLILIMSVNPGFGGQEFINHSLKKITDLKEMIIQLGLDTLIEVDGGVNRHNAKELVDAGADVLVSGNAIFKSADPTEEIRLLKSIF